MVGRFGRQGAAVLRQPRHGGMGVGQDAGAAAERIVANTQEQQEADIAHRLLELITCAANPRNIDLADLPDLVDAIRDICNDSHIAGNGRRSTATQRRQG
ncbi:hypothetical protein [Streptomyces bauhiniae]|uniref:hypothetical protein n=1 Tax=Streptomyces bauhiniae TaxID=2340725 RepID=UPI003658A1D8